MTESLKLYVYYYLYTSLFSLISNAISEKHDCCRDKDVNISWNSAASYCTTNPETGYRLAIIRDPWEYSYLYSKGMIKFIETTHKHKCPKFLRKSRKYLLSFRQTAMCNTIMIRTLGDMGIATEWIISQQDVKKELK